MRGDDRRERARALLRTFKKTARDAATHRLLLRPQGVTLNGLARALRRDKRDVRADLERLGYIEPVSAAVRPSGRVRSNLRIRPMPPHLRGRMIAEWTSLERTLATLLEDPQSTLAAPNLVAAAEWALKEVRALLREIREQSRGLPRVRGPTSDELNAIHFEEMRDSFLEWLESAAIRPPVPRFR